MNELNSNKDPQLYNSRQIQNFIYNFRQKPVILDRDIAAIYNVETRILNQAVKRNTERFPEEFMFQLSNEEFEIWKSQIVMSNEDKKGLRRPPYAFTEQGVAMLSAVLRSGIAIRVSIEIMNAFVEMRKILTLHSGLIQRVQSVEMKQLEYDDKFEKVFQALESDNHTQKQGVFFDGQTFEAYVFIADLIKTAKKSIELIDNYIDEAVLVLLTKRHKGVKAIIYSKLVSKALKLDLDKHNSQYEPIEIKIFDKSHDRFLIIDDEKVYHIGASLKDLGKKWFAFSLIEKDSVTVIEKIRSL